MKRDLVKCWYEALYIIKVEVTEVAYKTWIEPIRPMQGVGMLMLFVRSELQEEKLDIRYRSLIGNALRTVAGEDIIFKFVVESDEVGAISENEEKMDDREEVKLWEGVLGLLKDELPEVSINTWLRTIEPVKLDKNLLLRVHDEFNLEIVKLRYVPIIEACLEIAGGREIKCEFVVGSENVVVQDKRLVISEGYISQIEKKESQEITMEKLFSEIEQMRQEMNDMQKRLKILESEA